MLPKQVAKVKRDVKTRLTPRYKVILLNDNVNSAEYVLLTVSQIFKLSAEEAGKVMYEAHTQGRAIVTVLPLELAELRVQQLHSAHLGAELEPAS